MSPLAHLYDAAWRGLLPLALLRLWWRGRREPQYRARWAQRLGFWPHAAVPAATGPRLWLHAVSLGETRAAAPLIQALRQRVPGLQLILTTGTATGWEAGQSLLAPEDLHGWLPLDTPGATRRFMATLRPDLGVLMETETWPNLLKAAQQFQVPMVLANARLSARSLRKGQRWAALSEPMMRGFTGVLAQSDEDAARLVQAGAPPQAVSVVGNLKFDAQPSSALLEQGRRWRVRAGRRRVVLAASWRDGEDEPLLQAWKDRLLREESDRPRPLLLLVPRHPQRFDDVAQTVRRAGLSLVRRSAVNGGFEAPEGAGDDAVAAADVWLGDSLGEMPAYYGCADVALLGGSFAPLGGQNLIEAAACGCPVVMGPHTFNFAEAAQASLAEAASWRVVDLDEALAVAWGRTPLELDRAGQAALAFAARHGGATARTADRLSQWLSASPRAAD